MGNSGMPSFSICAKSLAISRRASIASGVVSVGGKPRMSSFVIRLS